MKYNILIAEERSTVSAAIELRKKVNEFMNLGWKPQGGASMDVCYDATTNFYRVTMCQAMIKEEE